VPPAHRNLAVSSGALDDVRHTHLCAAGSTSRKKYNELWLDRNVCMIFIITCEE